jgi:hypothetical protein
MNVSFLRAVLLGAAVGLLAGCGGGINRSSTSGAGPVSAQVSGSSPFSSSCGSTVPTGSNENFTSGSAVQPQIVGIPSGNLVGVWEQDRWSGLGARGIVSSHSTDGGATWSSAQTLTFSACGGGSGPGAGYDRASDPWITFAGGGVVYASALAFSANGYTGSGFSGTSGGLSAVLVSRSADGGVTWGTPVAVWTDTNPNAAGPFYFNDRDSITADPASGNVYVVWDRLPSTNTLSAPAYLAYSKDAGTTWTAGVMFDPGASNEAFNNQIVVLSNGHLLDFFTLFNGALTTSLQVIESTNAGGTWPTTSTLISNTTSVGTSNPITSLPIRDSSQIAQVAADPAGNNVAVVWQQSFTSGNFDGIALSLSKDNGQTWSTTPMQINGVKTVAAFSPTVRYLPGSALAVTYYDFRDYVSGSTVLSTSAWLTESSDSGATWHELRLQSPFDLNQAPLANLNGSSALFLGDNQGLALVSGNALPFYAATNSAGAHIYATQSPSPLSSPTAHVYSAMRAGPVSAAAAARARALVEQRLRMRAPSGPGLP